MVTPASACVAGGRRGFHPGTVALKYKSENVNGFHGLGHLFSDLVRDSEGVLMVFSKPTSGDVFCHLCVFSRALCGFWVSFHTCAFSGPEMGSI